MGRMKNDHKPGFMRHFKIQLPLRAKLLISFLVVLAISGAVSTWMGVRLIGEGIINQVQDKVRVDLNSARQIYVNRLSDVEDVIRMTASRFFVTQGLRSGNTRFMRDELNRVRLGESLDILTLTDSAGRVLFRTRNPTGIVGDGVDFSLIRSVLSGGGVVASTEILPREELLKEGETLAERAYLEFIPTPKAKEREEERETSGMMMMAAAPVFDADGTFLGILYGGVLLNRRYDIVDRIKETVYQGEVYKGKEMGTATIFQGDLRISTNVTNEDGSRAIGTRVSEEVYDQVLINGLPWIERAFVVNDWYITAYEPIRNYIGDIIGILYVGILEQKFQDLRLQTLWSFIGITLVGIAVAVALSYFLGLNLLRPLRQLVTASKRLAQGEFEQRVDIDTKDMIGELAGSFNAMVDSLRERDERLKEYTREKIMESERLATVGQLAAGVAHELNNPLGGVLIYSHLLLENLSEDDPQRKNLDKIVTQATRCKHIVKGLLDFSRQTEPSMEPSNINEFLEKSLELVENQAVFQNITITKDLMSSPPHVMADGQQIQQVFINIVLNAAEAMEGNGGLQIRTAISEDRSYFMVEFTDSGPGILEENIERLFEPFFTTKEVGRGTGLGLSISYGIIQKHNGTINVKSTVGMGTTFIIRLPILGKG